MVQEITTGYAVDQDRILRGLRQEYIRQVQKAMRFFFQGIHTIILKIEVGINVSPKKYRGLLKTFVIPFKFFNQAVMPSLSLVKFCNEINRL